MEKRLPTYMLDCLVTNNTGGASNAQIQIAPPTGTAIKIKLAKGGPDDYAAARTIDMQVLDSEDELIARVANDSVDNDEVQLSYKVTDQAASTTPKAVGVIEEELDVVWPDYFRIIGTSLANLETVSLKFRAYLYDGRMPTVTAPGSNLDLTTTYEVVG